MDLPDFLPGRLMRVALGVLSTACLALPLVRVAGIRWSGGRVPVQHVGIAAAFGVAFVADVAGLMGYSAIASQTYLVTLAAVMAAALVPIRRVVEWGVWVLLFVASLSIVARQGEGFDMALHVVAFVGIGALALIGATGRMRTVLAYGFTALAPLWCGFVLYPDLVSFVAYHGTWSVMALGVCGSLNGGRDGDAIS